MLRRLAAGLRLGAPLRGRLAPRGALDARRGRRRGRAGGWPRGRGGTPTPALVPLPLWWPVMLVRLTVAGGAIPPLLPPRGPPKPPPQATPTKRGPPHQRITGSPQPRGAQ